MPSRPGSCHRCGISGNERHVSRKGLCTECSAAAVIANARALQTPGSTGYTKWLLGCQAAAEARAAALPNDE